jgi:hypothetical protein
MTLTMYAHVNKQIKKKAHTQLGVAQW